MSYIGNTATTQNFASGSDYFNGDGSTTAFTLSRPVVSVNDVQAYVNSVAQTPNTAYTVSGSTITFTSAPGTGTNNIYIRYLSTTTLTQQPPYAPVILGDAVINGVTVGRGASYIASNTAIGASSLANNTTGYVNSALGQYSLLTNTTGIGNTAVGNASMLSNTSGYYNTAVGYAALYTNATGIQNNAMGYLSLAYNTTGGQNIAIGHQAAYNNTTGGGNVTIGHQAGYVNTVRNNTVLIGYQAGYNNVTDSSVGIGYQALFNQTTSADRNTAVGYTAGANLSSGAYNVALGWGAMSSGNTGSGTYNIALGYSALNVNTSGAQNIAIGAYSLLATTTSTYNIAIGYSAGGTQSSNTGYNTFIGTYAGNTTTGSSNIFVGSFTGAGASGGAGASITTGSNNTIIGNFNGNQNGLDMRTGSNYTIISDGQGNRTLTSAASSTVALQGASIYSGTGISFPATQVASSDANTLDDYEEGTFTPTVLIGGTSNSIATATGTYTKIGNVVFFACRAENVTKAGTGSLTMGNFPFVASSTGNQNRYSQFLVRWTGINSGGVIIALASVGNAAAEFQNFTTTGGYSGAVSDGSISASYSIYGVSGHYYTNT
jgi:hypothetical protein